MKIYLKALVVALALASNAEAEDCKRIAAWDTTVPGLNLAVGPFEVGTTYKNVLPNGGVLWTEGDVQAPGMNVVIGAESCIMTAGVNPVDNTPKECDDPHQTSKRVKVYSDDLSGPVDLVFGVVGTDDCATDDAYRFFLKYENLSQQRISSFSLKLGAGYGNSFEAVTDGKLIFTDRDGAPISSVPDPKDIDLAAFFAFGLFGDADTNPNHEADGYYDPSARAFFEMTSSTSGTIVAQSVTENFSSLYGKAMGNWIPKELAPWGYFYDIDSDPETDDLLVADWDGHNWVTRLLCTSSTFLDMRDASLVEENECRPLPDGTPVLLSSSTLGIWADSNIFSEGRIEDFGNVNVNTHIKVDNRFNGGTFTIRITPTADPNTAAPWLGGRSGAIMNDPHIKTWNGTWYDFMGQCDLVLLHAPNFHVMNEAAGEALTLDIHVRTKVRYDYSYIESAVVRLGEDTLQVDSYGGYFLNGVSGASLPAMLSGFPVTHIQPDDKQHFFTIELGPGEDLVLSAFKDMVSVKVDNADESRFHGSAGLMGEFDGQRRLLGRDGVRVIPEPNSLGEEWQVRDDEDMLFQVSRSPQYPKKCIFPDAAAAKKSRRLGHSVARKVAEKACSHWKENKMACINDVMKTGDVDLAGAHF